MILVSYKGHKYYIEQETQQVFDFKKQLISLKQCKEIGFETISQMFNYLSLHLKSQKIRFLDKKIFCKILSQNLKSNDILFPPYFYEDKLKGLNYSIIKIEDTSKILSILVKLKEDLRMEFVQEIICLKNLKIEKKDLKRIEKYISPPFGQYNKTNAKTIPFLIDKVINSLC